MRTRRPVSKSLMRRGFTLIELLVVISIIAVLMSLILPAIQNAREAGRRTQCLNHLKNLGLAVHNYANSRNRIPSYGYFLDDPTTTGVTETFHGRSWVVELLPYLDQQSVYDRWNKDVPWNDTVVSSNGRIATEFYFAVLTCPDDQSSNGIAGGLSFVANAGFGNAAMDIDLSVPQGHNFNLNPFDFAADGSGTMTAPKDPIDLVIARDCGMMWADIQDFASPQSGFRSAKQSQTLDSIYDGAANTILFTENMNAGTAFDAAGNTLKSWANPQAASCTFMFPFLQPTTSNGSSLLTPLHDPAVSATPYINEAKAGPEGMSPFPSSLHPGGVNYCNAEGGAKFIDELVDRNVYVQLITPAATRLRTGIVVEDPIRGQF